MIDIQNRTDFKFNSETIEKIAQFLTNRDVELLIVNSTEIRDLNRNSRGVDASTDVLSFPLEPQEHTPLGSIVINQESVTELSNRLSHSKDDEFALLFTHGLLHLLGFDHENDSGEMREKEREIISMFNLPKSLIIRTQE